MPTSPGSGPRHSAVDFRHNILYVIHEMGNYLQSFAIQADGTLFSGARVSSLPSDFTKFSKAAEIILSNGYVFVTNRGANTVGSFSASDLTPIEQVNSGGSYPRGLKLWAQNQTFWFVSNQDSSSLALFSGAGSKLTYLGVNISTPNPVTLVVVETS